MKDDKRAGGTREACGVSLPRVVYLAALTGTAGLALFVEYQPAAGALYFFSVPARSAGFLELCLVASTQAGLDKGSL